MKLKGKITIGRSTSSDGHMMRIEVQDEGSRVTFMHGEMSMHDFAMAITGHGRMPIALELRDLDVVGMLAEHKTEEVVFTGRRSSANLEANRAEAKEAIAPFEVDGWVGRWEDLFNGHNRVNGQPNTYRVHFYRWVPNSEGAAR